MHPILMFLYLLWYHLKGWNWDYLVYEMNGWWFFGRKVYFEWGRAPLTSLLLGIFGRYGYLVFLTALMWISAYLFARKQNLKNFVPILFSLPLVFVLSGTEGSEGLTLAWLMLSFVFPNYEGLFFGLATLSRYSSILFAPIYFSLDWKRILRSILFFLAVWSPWLAYNYMHWGDPFFSVKDAAFLNIQRRAYAWVPFDWHIAYVVPFLPALFSAKRKDWKMIAFLAIALLLYLIPPAKVDRYLYFTSLPFAYFIAKSQKFRFTLIASVIMIPMLITTHMPDSPRFFAIKVSCATFSDNWVYLNYEGIPSKPIPWPPEKAYKKLDEGYKIVLFTEKDYARYFANYTIVDKGRYVLIEDDKCAKVPYVELAYSLQP